MTIAKTILNQIKTIDPAAMMAWGAKELVARNDGLQFKSSGMVKWKGIVVVKYNEGTDLYDIEFGKIRKYEWKVSKTVQDVFVEDLVNQIDLVVG